MNRPESFARPAWAENDRLLPMLAAALVFLAVYAVELTGFGLSIDEEIAILGSEDRLRVWLQQGRWGMSLVTWVLPNFEGLPVLSTLLFGLGLLLATWRALLDFELRGARAASFAVVHVGLPIWLHIAQFSTLAAGFGIGIAAAAIGAGLCAGRAPRHWLAGLGLMAFATAVYQTLAVYAALYLVLLAAARWLLPVEQANARARLRLWLRLAACWMAALLVYLLVQWLCLRLANAEMTYVGGFVDIERLRADPGAALELSWRFVKRLVNGHNRMYLGWGMALLAMSWIGLLFPALPEQRASAWWRRGHTFVVFALGIALILGPVFLSYATLPGRAQVAWPLLAAWLAARCPFPDRRFPWVRAAALGYFAIVATSIGATMFYADRLARDSDREISQRLVPEMLALAAEDLPAGKPIPFTVSGIHRYPLGGQALGAEMFGASFFEHDGGSVWRIHGYWKVLGIHGFEPRLLSTSPAAVAAVAGMPNWPARGSVRLVDGIVVVRFGEPTPGQLAPRELAPR